MIVLQFIIVLAIALGSWTAMCYTMHKLKPSILSLTLILVCCAGMVGAFTLGSYWGNVDFACKPGAHCFPWGN